MKTKGRASDGPVAVIDLGSNSGRVVVYRRDAQGQLRLLASTRAALRLVREVDAARRLSREAIERTLQALRDFKALARGAGATRVAAIATAAMRDASNGDDLIGRARRELGLRIEIVDGRREALFGFLGALYGLPVEDGWLFDLGGGSLQLTRFRARRRLSATSLPLGALRLSQAFLKGDPPGESEIRRLRKHVRRLLEPVLEPLRAREELVATGGTVRNLAKVDRNRHGYPITRVHGYELPRRHVQAIAADLAARKLKKRDSVRGLSDERADSIVGGALAIETLMEVCDARSLTVSGQGVREGLAFSLAGGRLPRVAQVRDAAIDSLGARFAGWEAHGAARRAEIASELHRALAAGDGGELRRALHTAARLLDVGRAVDFFDRHRHAADVVLAAELSGHAHREIALVSAVLRHAGDDGADALLLRPLLNEDDRPAVARAGVLLALADDLHERCVPGARVELACLLRGRSALIRVPALPAWRERRLDRRFERAFGRRLVVEPGRT